LSADIRLATRYPFDSRVVLRLHRGKQTFTAQGWARDLSESGLGAFVAKDLLVGEFVTIQIRLGSFSKTEISAKVVRQIGTRYGFQFTALSTEQRLEIRGLLKH
jgi:hypothetical protein